MQTCFGGVWTPSPNVANYRKISTPLRWFMNDPFVGKQCKFVSSFDIALFSILEHCATVVLKCLLDVKGSERWRFYSAFVIISCTSFPEWKQKALSFRVRILKKCNWCQLFDIFFTKYMWCLSLVSLIFDRNNFRKKIAAQLAPLATT